MYSCGKERTRTTSIPCECWGSIRFKYTNKLPETLGGNAFQLVNRTYEAGMHVHFVKFDPLVSDGANVGWNYDSAFFQVKQWNINGMQI